MTAGSHVNVLQVLFATVTCEIEIGGSFISFIRIHLEDGKFVNA